MEKAPLIYGKKLQFTTLGAKGCYGPTSLDHYINTPLYLNVTLINGIQEWGGSFLWNLLNNCRRSIRREWQ